MTLNLDFPDFTPMIILSIALLGLSLLFPTTVNIEPTPVNQPGQNNGMGRKRRYADYGDYADYGKILHSCLERQIGLSNCTRYMTGSLVKSALDSTRIYRKLNDLTMALRVASLPVPADQPWLVNWPALVT